LGEVGGGTFTYPMELIHSSRRSSATVVGVDTRPCTPGWAVDHLKPSITCPLESITHITGAIGVDELPHDHRDLLLAQVVVFYLVGDLVADIQCSTFALALRKGRRWWGVST